MTLPKKMLPLRLALFKQLLLLGSKGLQPAAAVAAPEAPPLAGGVGNVLSFPRSRVAPSAGAVLAPPKPDAPAEEVAAPDFAPQLVRASAPVLAQGLRVFDEAACLSGVAHTEVHVAKHTAAGEGVRPSRPCRRLCKHCWDIYSVTFRGLQVSLRGTAC